MTNTCIINHVQPGKKCYLILFMCLCVVTLLIVYFETRTLIKLKTSWGVTVSGIHMDETSKETLQTTVNNGSIPPLKLCQRNTFQVSNIKDNVTADNVKNATVLSHVQKGGIYKPRDCKPIDSVAIIIPYRDREKQLEIFINYMHAFLQRQQLQYGIFVVELARPTTFNRGILANVGFLAAQSTGLYNCYVIHDVDLFPLNDRNTYSCSNQFRHLSIENSKYKKGLPYSTYVGGVVAMKEATYMKMNGFSNLYFGWGGEDDDLEIRIKMAKFKLERPDKKVGIFKALPHGQDKMNQLNENRWKLLKATKTQWQSDGVNSLNYQTLSYKEDVLYTLIYVKAKQSDISNTTVIVTIDGVKIYESDLLTIRNKGKINTKIINAYLYLLQTQSDGKLLRVKYQFKFLKPELPKYSNSSGTEFIFIPVKISGSWCLMVIYTKQHSIGCLDPTGTRSSTQKTAEMNFIRNLYRKQFGIELQEITINKQNILYPESQYDSGLIIMMFAKALLKGKSLFFQQVDIDRARTVIESTLRQK